MIKYTVVVAFFSFFLEQALVSQIGQPNICLKTDEKELCVLEKMQDVFLAIGHNIQTKYRASCHKTLQGCISYGLYSRERRQDSGLKGRCIDDKSLGFYVYSMMKRQRSVISPVYCDSVIILRVEAYNDHQCILHVQVLSGGLFKKNFIDLCRLARGSQLCVIFVLIQICSFKK